MKQEALAKEHIDEYTARHMKLRKYLQGLGPEEREAVATVFRMTDDVLAQIDVAKQAISEHTTPGNFSYGGFTHKQAPVAAESADPTLLPPDLLQHPGVVTGIDMKRVSELVTSDPEMTQHADAVREAKIFLPPRRASVLSPASVPGTRKFKNLAKLLGV
mgnify:CR=1 FL=1